MTEKLTDKRQTGSTRDTRTRVISRRKKWRQVLTTCKVLAVQTATAVIASKLEWIDISFHTRQDSFVTISMDSCKLRRELRPRRYIDSRLPEAVDRLHVSEVFHLIASFELFLEKKKREREREREGEECKITSYPFAVNFI